MPIVQEGTINYNSLQVDDLYVVIIPPQTPLIEGYPTNGIGMVGTAEWGPVDKPILISDVNSMLRGIGKVNATSYDLATGVIGALKQGANNIYGIRTTDGSDAAASITVKDNAGADLIKLVAFYTGKGGNSIKVDIGPGSAGNGVAASGTVTIGGTPWLAADTATITVGGTAHVYTAVTGDNAYTIAIQLANKINAGAQSTLVSASVSGNSTSATVTITALNKGTIGNSITITAGKTSTGGTITAGGATLANGAGTQYFRVLVKHPYLPAEIFDNITGTLAGHQGTAGTVAAAIVSALNNGISGIRGPSAIVKGTAPSSPGSGSMINQSLALTGGTNGDAGVTTNILLGTDGTNRTGMYGLRNLPIIQFGIVGLTDSTSWATQQAFALSENCMCVTAFAVGQTPLGVVNSKLNSGIDTPYFAWVKDWLYLNDTENNLIRLVDPIGPTLGRFATLSPELSPGNKPIIGYLGTERTGYEGPGGSVQPGSPYSYTERAQMESNGILFFERPSLGGTYLGLRHGQNGSSDPTRNQIPYTRMIIFLSESMQDSLGWVINEPQTPELRRRAKSSVSAFLESLANPGPGRTGMIGDVNGGPCYSINISKTNNPDNLVALGLMFMDVQVKFWSIVKNFIVRIEAGASVTVREQNSTVNE